MSAYEFSTLAIACLAVVVAVLAVPRRLQTWLLPAVVAVVLMLMAVPVPAFKRDRVWLTAGVLIAVALGVAVGFLARWVRHLPPPPLASFDVDAFVDGARIDTRAMPATITGSYDGHAKAIRVVLQDTSERYYLQHPPLRMEDGGRWSATNIRIGNDITKILFVQVGAAGERFFDAMVDNHSWGAFATLPPNSRTIGEIAINQGA